MKSIFLTLCLVSLLLASQTSFEYKEPKPVKYVSPKNFSGLWYEIARTYNKFEENCVAATVEYKQLEDNKLKVFNRCFQYEIGGELISYNGIVEPQLEDNLAVLDKTYYWIFTKEYRIIYLDKSYETAIMSDKKMKNLWIMHRTPFMEEKKLNKLIKFIDNYMDTSKLIFTKQDKNGRYK
ncbi:MAG: lipocalin family protein [Campylobacteraceae bacterium]|nr:lipocalin family protein [Campylobacteraceae bacterium]